MKAPPSFRREWRVDHPNEESCEPVDDVVWSPPVGSLSIEHGGTVWPLPRIQVLPPPFVRACVKTTGGSSRSAPPSSLGWWLPGGLVPASTTKVGSVLSPVAIPGS